MRNHGDATLRRFYTTVADRDGVFTWVQATDFGVTEYQIRRGLADGLWSRYQGAYQLVGALDSPRARLRAVLANAGHGTCATGPSALLLWNLEVELPPQYSSVSFIIVPPGRKVTADGVRFLRDRAVEMRTVSGIDTVTRERAVVDALRLLSIEDARPVLYRALQLRWVNVEKLTWWSEALRGRKGNDLLRAHLGDARAGSHAESERELIRLLKAHKFRGWQANAPIYDADGLIGYGDIVFVEHALVIEVDGRAWHSDAARFQHDRTRQNRLINAGCRVLRFTWSDLIDHPNSVVEQIRRALDVSST